MPCPHCPGTYGAHAASCEIRGTFPDLSPDVLNRSGIKFGGVSEAENLRQERHHEVLVAVLTAQVQRSGEMLLRSVIDGMVEAADYAATKAYPPPKEPKP